MAGGQNDLGTLGQIVQQGLRLRQEPALIVNVADGRFRYALLTAAYKGAVGIGLFVMFLVMFWNSVYFIDIE